MGQITIEGKAVNIDDAFFSLSPDEQNATVDEIAQELGLGKFAKPTGPVSFDQGASELSALTQAAGSGEPVDQAALDLKTRAYLEANKIDKMRGKGTFSDLTDSVVNGATFGWADELNDYGPGALSRMVMDGVGYGEATARNRALSEERQKRRQDRSPIASLTGDIAGGLMTGGGLAKGGMTMAGKSLPYIGRAGAMALEGAGYGAVAGAGNANSGDKLQGAAVGAGTGAITGGILSKGGDAIAGAVSKRMAAKANPAPAVDQLKTQAQNLYSQARAANVTVKPKSVTNLVQSMEMAAGRLNRDLRPNTAGVVNDIAALKGKPLGLDELDELRQTVGLAMKRAEPQDVRTLTRMKDILDDFADNKVTANDVTGDIRGFDYIKQAREVWSRKAKSEILQEINEKAMNQATGYENGLIVQLRQLANNKNRLKQFSPSEQKAIKDAVRRGNARGVLAMIGRLSPNSTFGGITTGGAMVGSGVLPGMALGATGFAAKKGAESLTRGKFKSVQDLVALGGSRIMPKVQNRALPFIPGLTTGAQGLLQQQYSPRSR